MKSILVFDNMATNISNSDIQPDIDWSDSYPDTNKEIFPPNCPKPRGSVKTLTTYTDANHVVNLLTRRFHTLTQQGSNFVVQQKTNKSRDVYIWK